MTKSEAVAAANTSQKKKEERKKYKRGLKVLMEVCVSGSRCAAINGDELVNSGNEFLRCFLSELYMYCSSAQDEKEIGRKRMKKTKKVKEVKWD